MWVFLNNAFLSIVADRDSDRLLVRGRVPGDIERVFPGHEVLEGAGTDYRFRAWVEREAVAMMLFEEALNIPYTNFKGSVMDNERHDVYLKVWGTMMGYQRKKEAPPKRRKRDPGDDDEFDLEFWNPVRPNPPPSRFPNPLRR